MLVVLGLAGGFGGVAMTVRDAVRRDDTDQDTHDRLARGYHYEELPIYEKQDGMALWPQLATAGFVLAAIGYLM